jgi:hypothetical protein
MAEPGWPLIPREVLPAPIAAVRRAKRTPVHVDGVRQLSIFGAETTEPSPADLAGLLAGPGRLGRMGGTARVSVAVDAAWRVHVLVGELVARGLVVSWLPIPQEDQEPTPADVRETGVPQSDGEPGGHTGADTPDGPDAPGSSGGRGGVDGAEGRGAAGESGGRDAADGADGQGEADGLDGETVTGVAGDNGRVGGSPDMDRDRPGPAVASFEVRTAYSSLLNGLARAWPPPPDRLFLSGPRLRLWVAAAGEPRLGGYALRLDPVDNPEIADSALVRAGLAGTVSDQGLYYLISGKKRLRRLAELVGERPAAAPEHLWPGGAAA